jgi:hypothetical protein
MSIDGILLFIGVFLFFYRIVASASCMSYAQNAAKRGQRKRAPASRMEHHWTFHPVLSHLFTSH